MWRSKQRGSSGLWTIDSGVSTPAQVSKLLAEQNFQEHSGLVLESLSLERCCFQFANPPEAYPVRRLHLSHDGCAALPRVPASLGWRARGWHKRLPFCGMLIAASLVLQRLTTPPRCRWPAAFRTACLAGNSGVCRYYTRLSRLPDRKLLDRGRRGDLAAEESAAPDNKRMLSATHAAQLFVLAAEHPAGDTASRFMYMCNNHRHVHH